MADEKQFIEMMENIYYLEDKIESLRCQIRKYCNHPEFRYAKSERNDSPYIHLYMCLKCGRLLEYTERQKEFDPKVIEFGAFELRPSNQLIDYSVLDDYKPYQSYTESEKRVYRKGFTSALEGFKRSTNPYYNLAKDNYLGNIYDRGFIGGQEHLKNRGY